MNHGSPKQKFVVVHTNKLKDYKGSQNVTLTMIFETENFKVINKDPVM